MRFFLQGLTMGLAYVAPIGLQNLFVINSALTHTRRRALATALIVIFFDVTLALGCFFGIGALMQRYEWLQKVILLLGSGVVLYIGIGLLRAKTEEIDRTKTVDSLSKTVTSACVVTWFNPQALIDGTMMLGAFRATLPPERSMIFISGVAAASCLWFMGLTLVISLFSDKFNAKAMRTINVVCGVVILFYGTKLLWNFIAML